jgi:nicotinate-nucleotide adenylyltransferase
MRLGIFGGTFDPPHLGHLILAQDAQQQLGLERILWVLTPIPPHKGGQNLTPLEQRLELLQAALAGNPEFELSRVEIDRSPPYYAVETMRLLRQSYPQARLVYLMGSDSLLDLRYWNAPREFVTLCDEIGVMQRPGKVIDVAALEADFPGMAVRLRILQTPLLEVASSQIRRRIAAGERYRYFLPEGVYRLIQERGFYRGS